MILFVLAWLAQPAFQFSAVQPWRWSEGRGEFIPALAAGLDNRSGQDFLSVRLLVRVACKDGSRREYSVAARDILAGPQRLDVTAYDSIGKVSWCDGAPEVIPLEAVPYPPQERPAFLLFGFSRLGRDGRSSSDLEGILDYRHDADSRQSVEVRSWRRFGARFTLPGAPGTVFYMIRVPPGRAGLAGFVLEPGGELRSPVSRFLRFYEPPPGKAAYLGVFELEELAPGRHAVRSSPAPDWLDKLAPLVPRPVVPVRGAPPPPGSALVVQ